MSKDPVVPDTQPAGDERVVVRDLDVPFDRCVVLCIKWALAAVPALILLVILYLLTIFTISKLLDGGRARDRVVVVPASDPFELPD